MCGGNQSHSLTVSKLSSCKRPVRRGVKSTSLTQLPIHYYSEFIEATLMPKLQQIADATRRHHASDTGVLAQMRLAVSSQFREINEIQKSMGDCTRPVQSMV